MHLVRIELTISTLSPKERPNRTFAKRFSLETTQQQMNYLQKDFIVKKQINSLIFVNFWSVCDLFVFKNVWLFHQLFFLSLFLLASFFSFNNCCFLSFLENTSESVASSLPFHTVPLCFYVNVFSIFLNLWKTFSALFYLKEKKKKNVNFTLSHVLYCWRLHHLHEQ